jgi:hypothetical protein
MTATPHDPAARLTLLEALQEAALFHEDDDPEDCTNDVLERLTAAGYTIVATTSEPARRAELEQLKADVGHLAGLIFDISTNREFSRSTLTPIMDRYRR